MEVMPDEIVRSIEIAADAETVFALVSQPGWWINDGTITDNHVSTEGDISTVVHETYGAFRIRTVEQSPPDFVSFRWLGGEPDSEAHEGAPGNLVEFRITGRPGGVTLTVRESGFTELPGSDADRRRNFDANLTGWEQELEAARSHLEAA